MTLPLEIICWPRSVSCLRAVVLPPSHFLILESFHSPLPLLASSVVLVHEFSHHITPLVPTPLFLVHESSHSSILPPIFSSAMPYFAFFSLFFNALLNDTFHPLLGILALLFCITPLARKVAHGRGSQWGCGFYGYRLKFWLFYRYRLIFSVTVNKKLKINFFCFKELNINRPDFFSLFKRKIKVLGSSRDEISRIRLKNKHLIDHTFYKVFHF